MWRAAGHQLLHENGGIAEGLKGLGARAFKGQRELGRGIHATNPVTAASGRGLDQQRIAQALGMMLRLGERFHRAATPRRNRYLGLLGQKFGADLVAQAAHDVAIRTDEHDAQLAAQVGELRVLGDKTPTYPDRFGARFGQHLFQQVVIDVAALGLTGGRVFDESCAERHRFVGFADEHRVTVGLGIECDGAQRCAVLLIELARRVDETHCGFTAIHDGHTLKFVLHDFSDQAIVKLTRSSFFTP